jgi:hypothetical protein
MSSIEHSGAEPAVVLDRLTPALAKPSAVSGFAKGIAALWVGSALAIFLASMSSATGGHASGFGVLAERPLAALQTIAGLSLCAVLLLMPALRGLARLWVRQDVHVSPEGVEILRHTPLGIARQCVPLNHYQGIAHHIRASLSGLTHEIILVHPNSAFSVTLLSAEHVTQAMLDEYKSLFSLPEIPARAIYEGGDRKDAMNAATPFSPASA